MNMNIEELLSSLTLEEKVALVSGHNFMFTNTVSRLNIPRVRMSDGPHGLRVQAEDAMDNGIADSGFATSFPTASCSANTWNPSLLEKMGKAIGEEARYYGIDIVLGPGVNIKRNPLCGRNFEYFSEDPFLAGRLGAGEVNGIQSTGTGVAVKHFALNNSENYRFMGDSIADMRAMREIYLRQFEYIVKNAKPETIMSSYNQINGAHASENKWLLNDLLRDEWGFDGLTMSDWGGVKDRVLGIKAGQDLEMPGDTRICRKWLCDAIKDESLSMEDLDKAVRNVLVLVSKHQNKEQAKENDWEGHNQLAKEIALEGAVLLKNDNVLPLTKEEPLLVIGELFEKMRYQGAGSSMINPKMLTTPKEAFDKNNINYKYLPGYKENKLEPDRELINSTIEEAKEYNKVILFLGLTDYVESEGCDRKDMLLPLNQLALVDALVKEGKEIVVVLYGGSPVELPFFDNVKGLLNMYLPGQCGGEATYELLFGLANPCGRLAETWPLAYSDVPFGNEYSNSEHELYKESIFVGYRYYLSKEKEARFPFGYGLSYSSFSYKDLIVSLKENKIIINVKVSNDSGISGNETVQIYISSPVGKVFKPLRELKGFSKVYLGGNESKVVTVEIDYDDLKFWAIKENRFVLEDGEYIIQVGKNSRDVVLSKTIHLKGEEISSQYEKEAQKAYESNDLRVISNELFEKVLGREIPSLPNKKPITLESRFTYLQNTVIGKLFHKAVLNVANKEIKKAKKMPEGPEKDNKLKGAWFLSNILESNSLRSLSMSAGETFKYNLALGFMDMSNGHIFKGLKDFMTNVKAPKLPDDKGRK